MEKIELEIVAISQNHNIAQFQSYAIILGEVNGLKKIPILIGNSEAQSIIIVLEKMFPSRPLTHDLFINFFEKLKISVEEVYIHKLEDNIFYSKIFFQQDGVEYTIDSRTSDAIAIAIRCGCPIYTNVDIIQDAGVIIDDATIEAEKELDREDMSIEQKLKHSSKTLDFDKLTIKELQQLLEEVVKEEDYLKAVEIRNAIQRKRNK